MSQPKPRRFPCPKAASSPRLERRTVLKTLAPLSALGAASGLAWGKPDEHDTDAMSGATVKLDEAQVAELEGPVPHGKLGDLSLSRLILGGNLIGGWAHARDLLYASRLFKEYNTREKIFETLMLCEHASVNSIVGVPGQLGIIKEYNEKYDRNFLSITMVNSKEAVDEAVAGGASALYIIGNHCDWQVRDGKVDELARLLDYMHEQPMPAGIGAHSIQALEACDQAGLAPDFFVKTLHHDRYWSAHPRENRIPFSVDTRKSPDHDQFHDNMFCLFPDETIAFMKGQSKPWIAFKVLAAGAIPPEDGFAYAFDNGADFICVGMFDFQVIQDANTAVTAFRGAETRSRPWRG